MTRFKKILLAGTATFALMAAPAMAIDAVNGATSGVSGAATGVTGSTSGAAGAGSSIDQGRTVGGAGGSVGVGAGAGSNGVSAGAGVKGAGNAGDNSLTGQTGINGSVDTPSPAQTESNVRGAAEAARESTQGMTGGAAAGAKGAVSSDTEADDTLGDGASLPNTANDTLAQVGGTGGAMDTLGSGGTTSPADTGVTGTTGGSTDRIVGDEGAGSTAGTTPVPEMDPTSELTGQGYTNIQPVEGAAATEGQATYKATNADGEPVEVTVDSRTGAVVSETGADGAATGTMDAQ